MAPQASALRAAPARGDAECRDRHPRREPCVRSARLGAAGARVDRSQRRGRRVRRAARAVGLRQVDAAASGVRSRPADGGLDHRRRGDHRQPGPVADPGVPGPDPVSLDDGLEERRDGARRARRARRAAQPRRRRAEARGPERLRTRLSASALGRHGAARLARPRAGQRSRAAAARRAARQAQLAHPPDPAGRTALALAGQAVHRHSGHPRCRGGGAALGARHRAQRAARRASRRNSPSTFPIRVTATIPKLVALRRQILGTLGLET